MNKVNIKLKSDFSNHIVGTEFTVYDFGGHCYGLYCELINS